MYDLVYENLKLDDNFPFAFFRTSDRQSFLHYHDCLELNIVEEGCGCYLINGKRYDIKKGDIFVINNKEPHMAVHDKDFYLSVIVFDIKLLWRNKGISEYLTPFFARKEEFSHKIVINNKNYHEMVKVFNKIYIEYSGRDNGWELAVESLLMYLLTLIYRAYNDMEELDENSSEFQKIYSMIRVVLEYIGNNFREDITLDLLAKQVSLSPHYLCRCFKKVTGRTTFAYIEQMRVQYSCYLLKTTDKSIMEIALSSGFNSVNYFNRVFKKNINMTPKQYRRQKR